MFVDSLRACRGLVSYLVVGLFGGIEALILLSLLLDLGVRHVRRCLDISLGGPLVTRKLRAIEVSLQGYCGCDMGRRISGYAA